MSQEVLSATPNDNDGDGQLGFMENKELTQIDRGVIVAGRGVVRTIKVCK